MTKKGIVVKSTGSWYSVKLEDGQKVDCRIKGKFRIQGIKSTNPVAVGDVVTVDLSEEGSAIITGVEDRKNYIIRRATKLSKQTHIIAANMDQALLIVSLREPKTLTGFIDRFLVTAEAYRIPVIIVYNKIDIYDKKQQAELAFQKSVYEKTGYPCLEASAMKKIHIEELKNLLKDKISLLCGPSGTGKSSLINLIEPGLDLKTRGISARFRTGKHTTTFAEMFNLSFGGSIIDTPGIKSFGIVDFKKEELYHYFPEIFRKSKHCKYHNCMHINEPDCAVQEAVMNGEIAEFRYQNYLNLYYGEDLEMVYE